MAAAAASYAATVFAAGFLLGTIRVLVVAPALGEVAAVLAELPPMLAVSAVAALWAVRRHAVPATVGARLAMGALAFALLMAAEIALGILAFGQSLASVLGALLRPAGLLGLAGQAAFALMPLILLARGGRLR